jgi:hypothetical protein
MTYSHNVLIEFGLQTAIEFTSVQMDGSGEGCMSFCRFEDEGAYLASKGMVFVNLNKQSIAFSYDIFDIKLDITEMKKVDNSYHFKCVNDLLRVDVYIVEYEKWDEFGKELFIS